MKKWEEQNERCKRVESILKYARVLPIEEFERRLQIALRT